MKRKLSFALLALAVAALLAVGIAFAATVSKERRSDFDFSFGALDAALSVNAAADASFQKAGDSVSFTISVANRDADNGITYDFTLVSETSLNKSQFLCYLDEEFIGTLASLENAPFGAAVAAPSETRGQILKIEYQNGQNLAGALSVTLTCTAENCDTSQISFVSTAEELTYLLRSIDAGDFSARTIALTADVALTLPMTVRLPAEYGLIVDTLGHTLDLSNTVFTNGKFEINSSRAGGAVNNLKIGTGAFVLFRESLAEPANVTVSADALAASAQEALCALLAKTLQGRAADAALAARPLGNLTVYQSLAGATIVSDAQTLRVTVGGKTFAADIYGEASAQNALSAMLTAQGAVRGAWEIGGTRTTYDLYLPVRAGAGTVVWSSDTPSVLAANGRYTPAYQAKTVTLTAAIFENGTTNYLSFQVRTAGVSFQERLNFLLSFYDETVTVNTLNDPYELFSVTSYAEKIGRELNLSDISMEKADAADSFFELSKDGASGMWSVKVVSSAPKSFEILVVGTFDDEDGVTGKATGKIALFAEVKGTDPAEVVAVIKEEAAKIDVLDIILRHLHCDLHTGEFACGEGSFTLPSAYPLGSKVNASAVAGEEEAEYIVVYSLFADDTANHAAVTLKGTSQLVKKADGTTEVIETGHVFDLSPEKLRAYGTYLHITVQVSATNSGNPMEGGEGDLVIELPAALAEGDADGFTGGGKTANGIDYAFETVRDAVEKEAPVPACSAHEAALRKFILLERVQNANTRIAALDLGGSTEKITSVNGLAYFTSLKSLDLSNSLIGNVSSDGETQNMNLIAAKTSLTELNLQNAAMTDISAFTSLRALETIFLNGNANLRNLSPLLYSSKTLQTLDLCGTFAMGAEDLVSRQKTDAEGNVKTEYYHSVLEQMYGEYQKANADAPEPKPAYYIGGHGAEHILYVPYDYTETRDDIIMEIAKVYAYRFENIIELSDTIFLQNSVVTAPGEPSATIAWEIADVTDREGNKISADRYETTSSGGDFSQKALYLDLGDQKRLTKGYTSDAESGKAVYSDEANGWVVKLKMSVTVAGVRFDRYFYVTVTDKQIKESEQGG